jgi:alpha-ribazole phosphatase
MDLVLIRHPAVGIDAGICYGQSDVPLAYDVAGSARVLDQRMRALKVPACVGAWHTSPLQRCALLADALGASHADPRLMEIDFGAWEGRAWDDIDRALLDAWADDLEHARAHGGESLAQFSARVGRWFDETCRDGDAFVHVVMYVGVIRVLTVRLIEARPASVL